MFEMCYNHYEKHAPSKDLQALFINLASPDLLPTLAFAQGSAMGGKKSSHCSHITLKKKMRFLDPHRSDTNQSIFGVTFGSFVAPQPCNV